MKASIAVIKHHIKFHTRNTGLMLSKQNPYWANNEQIKFIEEAIDHILVNGQAFPNRCIEISEHQHQALKNYVQKLKNTYLS